MPLKWPLKQSWQNCGLIEHLLRKYKSRSLRVIRDTQDMKATSAADTLAKSPSVALRIPRNWADIPTPRAHHSGKPLRPGARLRLIFSPLKKRPLHYTKRLSKLLLALNKTKHISTKRLIDHIAATPPEDHALLQKLSEAVKLRARKDKSNTYVTIFYRTAKAHHPRSNGPP